MKQAEVQKVLDNGKVVMFGTYWSGHLEGIMVRDRTKENGPRRQSYVAREIIMTETDPVIVQRWLKDTDRPEMWRASASRGEKVVVLVQSMSTENGSVKLGGVVERIV